LWTTAVIDKTKEEKWLLKKEKKPERLFAWFVKGIRKLAQKRSAAALK